MRALTVSPPGAAGPAGAVTGGTGVVMSVCISPALSARSVDADVVDQAVEEAAGG